MIDATTQQLLFPDGDHQGALPLHYRPRRPAHFPVERIVLAKGSLCTQERREFVERVCAVYPEAAVSRQLGIAHSRIELSVRRPLDGHRLGKRTLVIGELRSAVRFSEEEGNTCPNYWHFSPYGYCPYGCNYCYLAGTPVVWHSPTVKVFVNVPAMVGEMGRIASRLQRPVAFYLGKLQDGLALDGLTGYSTVLVPFFARHPFARQIVLTKCADVANLLDPAHGGHTILSWSLNPPEVARLFEQNAPDVDERLEAMRRCAASGYPVRAVLMPIIPIPNWQGTYAGFIRRLLTTVPIARLTLGGICSYKNSRYLMECRLGPGNVISRNMQRTGRARDGRTRYAQHLRIRLYDHIIRAAREVQPDIPLALCLEELAVWKALGLEERIGKCNCVL